MLRLERILINGFKTSKSSANVVFSPTNTSIIFGQNGCGKTSFLKIIHAIFVMDDAVLVSNSVNKIEIYYSQSGVANSVTIKRRYETGKPSEMKSNYDWDEYISSPLHRTSSLSLGVDRGVSNQQVKIDPRMIFDFFRTPPGRQYLREGSAIHQISELLADHIRRYQSRYRNHKSAQSLEFEKKNLYLQAIKMDNIEELLIEKYRVARLTATRKIQSALFDTLSLAISLDDHGPSREKEIPYNFNALILEHAARLIEALDDGSDNNFKNRVIEILKSENLEQEVTKLRNHAILSQLFLNMINELKLEQQMLNSINILTETFNQYLINGKELIVDAETVAVKVGSTHHSISELSSGERHMLTFLSLVLFEGGRRDYLIIDEPEISLNLVWQRKLMGLLSTIIPDTQIIVASHSPSLAHNNPNFLCELELKLG